MSSTNKIDMIILTMLSLYQDTERWKNNVNSLILRGCLSSRECDCGFGPHYNVTQVGKWTMEEIGKTKNFQTSLVGALTIQEFFGLAMFDLTENHQEKFVKSIESLIARGLCRINVETDGTQSVEVTGIGAEKTNTFLERLRCDL